MTFSPADTLNPAQRAQDFVRRHRANGLSYAQIAFLAQLNALCDRSSIRLIPHGRRSLLDIGDMGMDHLRAAAAAVQSPKQAEALRTSLLATWGQAAGQRLSPSQLQT